MYPSVKLESVVIHTHTHTYIYIYIYIYIVSSSYVIVSISSNLSDDIHNNVTSYTFILDTVIRWSRSFILWSFAPSLIAHLVFCSSVLCVCVCVVILEVIFSHYIIILILIKIYLLKKQRKRIYIIHLILSNSRYCHRGVTKGEEAKGGKDINSWTMFC